GDPSNNMATTAGAVYIYTRAGTTWGEQAYIKSTNTGQQDEFGYSVALSADGNTLAVSAPDEDSGSVLTPADDGTTNAGAAYIYTRAGTTWSPQAYVKPQNPGFGDYFGYRISLSGSGDVLVGSAVGEDTIVPNSGAAYDFTRTGTTWSTSITTFKAAS